MEAQAVSGTLNKAEAVPPQPEKAEKAEAPKRTIESVTMGPQAAPNPSALRTLSVSTQAVEAIRKQVAKRGTPDAAIRVGVRGGGCSGFSYVIEYDDKPARSGDIVLEFAEEGKATVRVFCDKKSILYLAGSVLDWEKTLMYTGFKFKNPQEATKCGCGHSFTVA